MKSYLKLSILLLLFLSIAHGQKESDQSKEFKKLLNGITLPIVSLKKEDQYTLPTAMAVAVSRAIENDPFRKNDPRAGFGRFVKDKNRHIRDCVIYPEGSNEIIIAYEARNILLHDYLVEIARQSKLDLYATSEGLVFSRPDKKSRTELLNKKLTIWFSIHKVEKPKTPKKSQQPPPQGADM